MIETMLITNSLEIAKYASENDVDRIFIDTERLGKEDRQKNLNLPLNTHSLDDIEKVKKVIVGSTKVLVRINPPNKDLKDEVNRAIDGGADIIMLPFFTQTQEVELFLRVIDSRCRSSLLVETGAAIARIETIAALKPDEIHLGLNDLRLSLGLRNIFELLINFTSGAVGDICNKNGISFGIGGIGSISLGADISPASILKEYARLNSKRVILSRAFTNNSSSLESLLKTIDLKNEVALIKNKYADFKNRSVEVIAKDKEEFARLIQAKIVV